MGEHGRRRRSGCTVLTGPLFLPVVSVSDPFYYIIVCSCSTSRTLLVHRYDLHVHTCVSPYFTYTTICGDQCLQHVFSYKVTKLAVSFKMATIADVQESIPSLPDELHYPKRIYFPKRSFGKTKCVFCSAKSKWYDTRPSQKTARM